jgi:hypothetical protein
VRSLVAVLFVAIAGCGGSDPPKRAAVTPTPTPSPSPAASPAVVVEPASAKERAEGALRDFVLEHTQEGGRLCVPDDTPPRTSIAAENCDFRGSPQGSFVLFKTRKAMRAYYTLVRAAAAPIPGTECSGPTWYRRKSHVEGKLHLGKLGARTVLIWSDDSERVVGTIRTKTASTKRICGLWREAA